MPDLNFKRSNIANWDQNEDISYLAQGIFGGRTSSIKKNGGHAGKGDAYSKKLSMSAWHGKLMKIGGGF